MTAPSRLWSLVAWSVMAVAWRVDAAPPVGTPAAPQASTAGRAAGPARRAPGAREPKIAAPKGQRVSERGRGKPGAQPSPWTETSSGHGIITFKRDVHGSEIIDLLGEGIVEAPIVRVASVLLDYTRATEWIDSLEEVRVVRMLGPLEFIEYDHVGTPPIIMKDRDFVCHGKLALDLEQQSLVMTIEPTTDPALPPTHYIRGELRGYWKLKAMDGGRRTFVIAQMHGDPRGSVPKWLVNLFQQGWARNTIESLREQVKKPDIHVMPQVEAAFEGKPIAFAIKSK